MAAPLARPGFLAVVALGLALGAVACSGGAAAPLPGNGAEAPTALPEGASGAGTGSNRVHLVNNINVCPEKGIREMTGAGATFPFPLLSAMVDDYFRICGVRANYQSIGSGGGIRQVQAWTVDWGASEAIMGPEQEAEATGGHVLHIPFAAGALAIVYNLPGIPHATMKITPDVLAAIYLKEITRWNDPRLQELNPDLDLPNQEIAVVHRSDGSGTTYVFTHYLSQVSPEWSERVGYATSVRWPGDIGGPGNEGVTNQVRQIPGAIGYVERAYAIQTQMSWILMQNQAGNFVEPTQQAAALAADVPDLPDDMRVMVTNTSHPEGYPISGFAWLLVYEKQRDEAKADAVARFAYWAMTEGQKHHDPLQYVPIISQAQEKALALIERIEYPNGQPALSGLTQ